MGFGLWRLWIVSIHAPRFWGAMPSEGKAASSENPFQSTLPVSGERCRSAQTIRNKRIICFNPRSPFPGSDAVAYTARASRTAVFQSTLPVSGERCFVPGFRHFGSLMFQSTLPVSGERCLTGRISAPNLSAFQSTLPVSGERCLPDTIASPPPKIVSIHAPRFRGAMPASFLASPGRDVCFNPRSPFPGSDALRPRNSQRRRSRFQSTLPVSGERCPAAAPRRWQHPHGFNPRSPFPGSDAGLQISPVKSSHSFNPRSPFPGSDASLPTNNQSNFAEFQSTLPVSGERCRCGPDL